MIQQKRQKDVNQHDLGRKNVFPQADLGERGRTWHLTTIQRGHWALHLDDSETTKLEVTEKNLRRNVWTCGSAVGASLPAVGAETASGPGWSDGEGPRGFWVKPSVLSGTWKSSSLELWNTKSTDDNRNCQIQRVFIYLNIDAWTHLFFQWFQWSELRCVNREHIRKQSGWEQIYTTR